MFTGSAAIAGVIVAGMFVLGAAIFVDHAIRELREETANLRDKVRDLQGRRSALEQYLGVETEHSTGMQVRELDDKDTV